MGRVGLFLFEGRELFIALAEDAELLAGGFDEDGVPGIGLVGGLPRERTTGMEGATGWRVGRGGDFALEDYAPALGAGVGLGDGGEKRDSVGVLGVGVEISGGGLLDDSAQIHHGNLV